MSNLRKWLESAEVLYEERIEAMCVGHHPETYLKHADENVLLSREDGLRKVDVEYDNGFGGADCFPLYAWTKSRVFFIEEYDGATSLRWCPREPMAIRLGFSGQDVH